MDDRIRASDADRDRVTARLREHFAAGRLSHDELDERVSAALHARTFGELRRLMADLPEPMPAPAGRPWPQPAAPRWAARPRSPLLPLVLIALIAAVLLPAGGWMVFAFVKLMLLLWLVAAVAGLVLTSRFRRRMRRRPHDGYPGPWPHRGYRR
jgi:DUF1707 SHOCT-like domain